MKRCFKCGIEKPLEEFYPHPHTADKHLNKCKPCTRHDVVTNREKKREFYNEKDRERAKLDYRLAQRLQWAKDNREKASATNAVYRAVKSGRLSRQPCEVCGTLRVDAHHDDYTKPLDVRWLCRRHHRLEHSNVV